MYLKSLEVMGFKSFANKMVLDFHSGITGIVGPNGSGKSNIADALRWVLGEQSAHRLRGSCMQDVIFSGTQTRKPLSYAYVSITLDNADHALPIDYEEVTVSRRIYRSGESEYLLNGSPCRLREVSELFYDTGIGKEGYSIIGQGQIDRILNSKPEERRELFDEAAGIVKYKYRRAATQKKLDREGENLLRIADILKELENRIGPLKEQAQKAKVYLRLQEEMKENEVTLFLLDADRLKGLLSQNEAAEEILLAQQKDTDEAFLREDRSYVRLHKSTEEKEEEISRLRRRISDSSVSEERCKSRSALLEEQIKTAQADHQKLLDQMQEGEEEKNEKLSSQKAYQDRLLSCEEQLKEAAARREEAQKKQEDLKEELRQLDVQLQSGQEEASALLLQKSQRESENERHRTLREQLLIQKENIDRRQKAQERQQQSLTESVAAYDAACDDLARQTADLKKEEDDLIKRIGQWQMKQKDNQKSLEKNRTEQTQTKSQLTTLQNLAEHYDGYGSSIRRVMECRKQNPGILGTVSDLLSTDEAYETALETALGAGIRFIVTEDEATAKRMIAYLKQNRFGRVTFLPLKSAVSRDRRREQALLSEPGVIALADGLVRCEDRFRPVAENLLGRILVMQDLDSALMLAKKNHYSLNIVTLDGEQLHPGGSLSGGSFQNAAGLLSRRRQIEQLKRTLSQLQKEEEGESRLGGDIEEELSLCSLKQQEVKARENDLSLQVNTASVSRKEAKQQLAESKAAAEELSDEREKIVWQLSETQKGQQLTKEELSAFEQKQQELRAQNEALAKERKQKQSLLELARENLSQLTLQEAELSHSQSFLQENIDRLKQECGSLSQQREKLLQDAAAAKADIEQKQNELQSVKAALEAEKAAGETLMLTLRQAEKEKEDLSGECQKALSRREELARQQADLEKEQLRLSGQKENYIRQRKERQDALWEQYELTPHTAEKFRLQGEDDDSVLRKQIASCREQIRTLGTVNVSAVDEYEQTKERYEFLKGQLSDIESAQANLQGMIDDLNAKMKAQFQEKFEEIKKLFDAAFQELFGGGHGTLVPEEGEDLLSCGIGVIASPPGKKLQNMMQLSGGERALTAIALLFAIQALRPSPFCLLDEIEAALDDVNVGRFASYLQKLSDHTQFIVITHRRGTMAAADRLYGITMQEKGVSVQVSVDLVEADLED